MVDTTFSRVFDGGVKAVHSRDDKWYCNFAHQSMCRGSISVVMPGFLLVVQRPSDDLPVLLCWSPKVPKAWRRLWATWCKRVC